MSLANTSLERSRPRLCGEHTKSGGIDMEKRLKDLTSSQQRGRQIMITGAAIQSLPDKFITSKIKEEVKCQAY